MICPKCNTLNDKNNAFCVNCGEVFRNTPNLPPTLFSTESDNPPSVSNTQNQTEFLSTPTVFGAAQPRFQPPPPQPSQPQQAPQFQASQANFNPATGNFNPSVPFIAPQAAPPRKSKKGLWIGAGVLLILLFAGGIIGAIVLMKKTKPTTEALPTYLGLFFQNAGKTSVEEIKKHDFTDGFDAQGKLLKDESMPAIESKTNLILYSDGKNIPLGDLKLVQLDSIKSDGTMKQLDFKASPVEGNPEMKRLWTSENLAKGKYAFALIDGFFDEGKHKFWAFQVKESDKADNAAIAKDFTASLKNKSKNPNTNSNSEVTKTSPTPKPTVAPPVGSRTAYASTNSLVIRGAPSLSAQKVGTLRKGQKVYVLGYSNNYDNWNGLEGTWANVQTETGQRGWVFSPLISY